MAKRPACTFRPRRPGRTQADAQPATGRSTLCRAWRLSHVADPRQPGLRVGLYQDDVFVMENGQSLVLDSRGAHRGETVPLQEVLSMARWSATSAAPSCATAWRSRRTALSSPGSTSAPRATSSNGPRSSPRLCLRAGIPRPDAVGRDGHLDMIESNGFEDKSRKRWPAASSVAWSSSSTTRPAAAGDHSHDRSAARCACSGARSGRSGGSGVRIERPAGSRGRLSSSLANMTRNGAAL